MPQNGCIQQVRVGARSSEREKAVVTTETQAHSIWFFANFKPNQPAPSAFRCVQGGSVEKRPRASEIL
jgi:hypothetical protein